MARGKDFNPILEPWGEGPEPFPTRENLEG